MALNLTALHSELDEAFIPQYTKRMKKRQLYAIAAFVRSHYNFDKIPSDILQLCFMLYFDMNTIIHDSWNLSLSNPELSFDEDIPNIFKVSDYIPEPKHAYDTNQYETRNAFGKVEVTAGEVQQWSIKVLNDINANISSNQYKATNVQFGIIRKDKISLDMTFYDEYRDKTVNSAFWGEEYRGYAYDSNGSKLGPLRFEKTNPKWTQYMMEEGENYGNAWGYKDTVTMTLDLTTNYTDNGKQFGLLSFAVNGEDQGIAFDDIPIIHGEVYVMAISIYYHMEIELLGHEDRKL